jgi:D-alanyl-lipoteichoic acid acyltransferase DltB (MBOAT superfamily)
MEFVSLAYFIWTLCFLAAAWISVPKYDPYILAAFGSAFIFVSAPLGGAILFAETLLCYFCIQRVRIVPWHSTVLLVVLILAAFLLCKYYAAHGSLILPFGISYFTFRLVHYVQERYRNSLRPHTLVELLSYMTFFPTYLVGPINLFPEFLTNLRRRQWNSAAFSKGLERTFYGYAVLIIGGNYLVNVVIKSRLDVLMEHGGPLGNLLLQSIHLWLDLYVRFSAYSSIAIGISAMAGFRIPENFSYPFLATNIKEFWQRWHISLTGWCREYIFIPLAAVTRRPYLAICATMIAVGIWHELSIRYTIWGLYHSAGIIVYEKWSAFMRGRLPSSRIFQKCYSFAGMLITILFVVFSFPLTKIVTQYFYSLWP